MIVHGYEEWGARVVERSAGCSPLRSGTSPSAGCCSRATVSASSRSIYAALDGDGVVFGRRSRRCSKIRRCRATGPEAIDAYLSLLYVPAPATVYKAVNKLPPAHVLVAENGSISVRRYWDLTSPETETFRASAVSGRARRSTQRSGCASG